MLEVSYWCLDTHSRVLVYRGRNSGRASWWYSQLVRAGQTCVAIDRVPQPAGCSERQFMARVGYAVLALVTLAMAFA